MFSKKFITDNGTTNTYTAETEAECDALHAAQEAYNAEFNAMYPDDAEDFDAEDFLAMLAEMPSPSELGLND